MYSTGGPVLWVLPGNNTNAGQGKPGIFAHKTKKIWACYVTYAGKRLSPGMMMEMGPGDDAQIIDPKGAATDATAFLKTQQGLIGAGQGLSYEAVSRDMSGATYSSARQNALEDENTYTEEVELLTTFMSEVYENFVISGVLSGLFQMPGFWDRKEEFLDHTWVKTPKKWIDPAKEANADKIALQSGQKTFQDLQAEKGKDWKDAVDELAEVLEYGRKSAALSTKAIGATVKLKENGTPVDYIVVHKGRPSSIYDVSCDGVWLLRKDIFETRAWHSSNVNDWANSTLKSYLDSTFYARFDKNIQSQIKQVKLPYRRGSGTSATITSGANGLTCKIFLLSATEVGYTNKNRWISHNPFGEKSWNPCS